MYLVYKYNIYLFVYLGVYQRFVMYVSISVCIFAIDNRLEI